MSMCVAGLRDTGTPLVDMQSFHLRGLVFVKDRFKELFFGRYSRGRSVWPVRFVILLVLVTKSGENLQGRI